uniref:Ig-like domain-containing protein n=1 Tax=Erpetoichthys calabaricus TaxID=27687 RepID=A0A8C4SU80_ERPCA
MAIFEGSQNTDRKDATMFRQDVLRGNASLLLQKIVKRDEGPYECEVEHKGQVDSATLVLSIQVPPEVSVSPESVHLLTNNTVTCSAQSFYPELITFIWKRSGKDAETQQHNEPQLNPDGTFNSESVYRFTPTSHDDLTCEVHHVALKEPLRRSVTYTGLTVAGIAAIVATVLIVVFIVLFFFWFFSVYLSPLHPSKLLQDESVSVQCTITSWNPEMIKLRWFINDREILSERMDRDGEDETLVPLQDPSNYTLHRGSSEKGFGPKETLVTLKFRVHRSDHRGAKLKCQATHLLTRRRVERSVPLDDMHIRPRLSEIENVSQNSDTDVKLQIRAEEFKPRDISFTWSLGGRTVTSDSLDITENPNGTFSVVSVCPVPLSVIQTPGFKVSVITDHISQGKVEKRATCDTPGIDGRPHLSDVEKVTNTKVGEPCTLSCTITKFFPSDISVTWLRVGTEIEHQPVAAESEEWPAKVTTPNPEMKNYIYEVTSEVQFTPKTLHEVEDMTYICRVEHVTLMGKTEEKKSGRLELTADKMRPTISDMHVRFTKFGEPCTLACTVSDFYPKKINVTWERRMKIRIKGIPLPDLDSCKLSSTNYGPIMTNNRYSLVSHATFTPQSLGELEDKEFFCTVEHESLKKKMEKLCSVTSGFQCCPLVSNVQLSNFNGFGQVCTLSCSIDNFFPKEIKVTWLKVGKEGKKEMKVKKATPMSEEKTYKMVSEAEFTPKTLTDLEEVEYICRVEHQTLKEPIERRNGKLVVETETQPAN